MPDTEAETKTELEETEETEETEEDAAKAAKAEEEMQDLIKLFTQPVNELSDEQLDDALKKMSQMRSTRIANKKKQDYITDIILPKLDTASAEKLLKKLDASESTEAAESADKE